MNLTGKAKVDFRTWYQNRLSVMTHSELVNINDETIFNAFIVEWLESVGVWKDEFYYAYRATGFKDYNKAVIDGIIESNKIYNSK